MSPTSDDREHVCVLDIDWHIFIWDYLAYKFNNVSQQLAIACTNARTKRVYTPYSILFNVTNISFENLTVNGIFDILLG
jgi:hypothetical protein